MPSLFLYGSWAPMNLCQVKIGVKGLALMEYVRSVSLQLCTAACVLLRYMAYFFS